MNIYGISDLHLSFMNPKPMEVFGDHWKNHYEKIEKHWRNTICEDDMVLMPGDISWAIKYDDAISDLKFIANLPGKKVLLKGNHDFWWPSISKLRRDAPKDMYFVQNDVVEMGNIAVTGTRLWDFPFINWNGHIHTLEPEQNINNNLQERKVYQQDENKIRLREIERLKLCLSKILESSKSYRIVLTHYPPVAQNLEQNILTSLIAEYKIDMCIFGHLHNLRQNESIDGQVNGVHYICVSCDYLNFRPKQIMKI